jgi:hypothetical protein
MDNQDPKSNQSDRRAFLQKCGRFAIVTPPAISMLLSTSLTSDAIAKSGGGKAKHHHGRNRGKSEIHRRSYRGPKTSTTASSVTPPSRFR